MCARLAALMSGTPALLPLLLLSILSPASVGAAVTTDPAEPLLGVPFFATDAALPAGSKLFASSDGGCLSNITTVCVVRSQVSGSSFRNGTCIFTVDSAALQVKLTVPRSTVPVAYWCVGNPGGARQVGTLQMHKMEVTPDYVFNGEGSTLTFGSAVPVETTVGLYAESRCNAVIPGGGPSALTNARTVKFTPNADSNLLFICASTLSVTGSTTKTALANAVALATPYTIKPTEGVLHHTVHVAVPIVYSFFNLATDAHCLNWKQADQTTSIQESIAFRVTAPRGKYFFCAKVSRNSVYIPAKNTFTVLEYDVVPHTLYAGKATDMSFALNAAPVQAALEAALSTSSDCTAAGNWQSTWSNPMQWAAGHPGVYYACVRKKANTADVGYASVLIVTDPPVTFFSPAIPVRGVSMRATLTHANATDAFFVIGISALSNCQTLLSKATASPASGTSVSLAVPLDAPSSLHFCVSNPLVAEPAVQGEAVRYYKLQTLTPQPFSLQHAPLRVGLPVNITLDSTVSLAKGTTATLVRAVASQPPCGATDMPTLDVAGAAFVLGPVTFPEAGGWDVCVREPGADYVAVRRVTVYGDATVTPPGIVAGVEGTIALRGLPPAAEVFVTSATACSSEAIVLCKANTSSEGAATLTLTSDGVGTLLLCCYYPDTTTKAMLQAAGSVRSANPRVAPAVVALAAQRNGPQALYFVAAGAASLSGHAAYLLSDRSMCPSGATVPSAAIALPALAVATGSDTPYATIKLSAAMVGRRYLVCVNTDGSFVATGTVLVVLPAPLLTADPATLAAGVPATIRLLSTYTSAAQVDTYAVVHGSTDCTGDLDTVSVLARGTINHRTGVAMAFLVPQSTAPLARVRVCVAPKSSLLGGGAIGYAAAGDLDVSVFAPLSAYAQLQRPASSVTGWPVHTAALQYLVRCGSSKDACRAIPAGANAACAETIARYRVGGATQGVLAAPHGSYWLCQSATIGLVTGTVAANATIDVVDAFLMSADADLAQIRAYVPFSATIKGGPKGTSFYSVMVQPATVPCHVAAKESQTFVSSESTVIVNVSAIEPHVDVRFCVGPTTTSSRVEAARATLRPYMSPAYIFADTPTTITLPSRSAGTSALLSSSRTSPVPVQGGSKRPLSGGRVSFTIDGCGDNKDITELFYHEFHGAWSVMRGRMLLIRKASCIGGGGAASIQTAYAAPGVPITDVGVNMRFLAVAGISTTSSSTSPPGVGVLATGYVPAVNEDAAFYVWAHPIGEPQVLFTTAAPTLRVRNWAVEPAEALSRYNATIGAAPHTLVQISDAVPPDCSFFSESRQCDASLGEAADMGTPAQAAIYTATDVSGTVYVCTCRPQTGAPLAVAAFKSLLLPQVLRTSPAIVRSAAYAATLKTDGYVVQEATVFLSSNRCAGSLPLELTVVSTIAVLSVSFDTANLAKDVEDVDLCVRTPGGTGAAIASVPVASGSIWPTQFALGATAATIFMPLSRHTTFQLSATETECVDVAGMPTFTTDGDGYATVSLLGPGGDALPLGRYAVCAAKSTRAVAALETIEVVPAAHFSVRGSIFVVGVPSRMELEQDLRAADLIAGFSTTATCSSVTPDHGTWTALSSTAIEVRANAVKRAGVFLCAQVPANGSIVALPHVLASPRHITFLEREMALPTGNWNTCTDYWVDHCHPPGGDGSTAADVLTVVRGGCCDPAAQAAAVGSASMASGTCRLRIDAAKVAAHPAGTSFSVCAWNPENRSACATLHTVAVTTNCTLSTVGGGSRLSKGAAAGIAVGCVASGVALVFLACLMWRRRRARENSKSMVSDGEDPCSSEGTGAGGAWEERQPHELLWAQLGNTATDATRSEELVQVGGAMPTTQLSDSMAATTDAEAPLDLAPNCMDVWPEVINKYYRFLDGSDVDYDTVSLIPGEGEPCGMDEELEAMLAVPPASALTAELEARRQAELRFVADRNARLLVVQEERRRMEEEDPIMLKMIILQEREEWMRAALEGHYRRADYNLTVLLQSSLDYCNALSRKRRSDSSESPSSPSELLSVGSWDVAPLVPFDCRFDSYTDGTYALMESSASAFSPEASSQRSIGKGSAFPHPPLPAPGSPSARNRPAGSQPSATETKRLTCSPDDLYRKRRFLEFPFVTNSVKTLIGCSGSVPLPAFVRGLPLVDLQAFHSKHRWLADPPRHTGSADRCSETKGMWAFMAPGSEMPFVRRYLTLFEKEFCGREKMLEADAAFWSRLFCEKRTTPVFSAFEEVETVYNPSDARSFCATSLEYRNLGSSESDSDGGSFEDDGKRHTQSVEVWAQEKPAPESIVEQRRVEQELASLQITKRMTAEEKKKVAAAQAAFRAMRSAERKARTARERAEAARQKAEAANENAKSAKASCERRSLSRTRLTSTTTAEEQVVQDLQRMEDLRRLGMR
ncbi:hypothetical protein LSCM1_02103 [Leishmania martiniquensis]|uniref:Uncharacterized protein n=1 Tax=Leishmania martiniquensis TaxID=1580590 RepID=A0A836H0H0_9TRYP|nr:hypothetical protein LSCM1_02103 [Leishmania martiniquensis]